jgi:hypothetical protein
VCVSYVAYLLSAPGLTAIKTGPETRWAPQCIHGFTDVALKSRIKKKKLHKGPVKGSKEQNGQLHGRGRVRARTWMGVSRLCMVM